MQNVIYSKHVVIYVKKIPTVTYSHKQLIKMHWQHIENIIFQLWQPETHHVMICSQFIVHVYLPYKALYVLQKPVKCIWMAIPGQIFNIFIDNQSSHNNFENMSKNAVFQKKLTILSYMY